MPATALQTLFESTLAKNNSLIQSIEDPATQHQAAALALDQAAQTLLYHALLSALQTPTEDEKPAPDLLRLAPVLIRCSDNYRKSTAAFTKVVTKQEITESTAAEPSSSVLPGKYVPYLDRITAVFEEINHEMAIPGSETQPPSLLHPYSLDLSHASPSAPPSPFCHPPPTQDD